VQIVAFTSLCCSWLLTWLVTKLDSLEAELDMDLIPASMVREVKLHQDAVFWGIVRDTFAPFLIAYVLLSVAASSFVSRDDSESFTAQAEGQLKAGMGGLKVKLKPRPAKHQVGGKYAF
jgi:hypothetical protein